MKFKKKAKKSHTVEPTLLRICCGMHVSREFSLVPKMVDDLSD